jgi:DNA polymerase III delta prime subunit
MQLLTERYRPGCREEIVGNKNEVDRLFGMVNSGKLCHIILEGVAGVGKTSCALVIAKQLFKEWIKSNFLELNASDERGIDVVREQVKTFAKTSPFNSTFKIILLDEGDEMCLPEDAEIIIGRKGTQRGYRTTKIQNFYSSRFCPMPSVNLETGKIEEDKGKLVDSGYADFYKLTLKDGRTVEASENHPFFILVNNKLQKILLKDLKVGNFIVDYQEDIMNKCKVCGKFTLNIFCGKNCRDIYHTFWMKKTGGFMFGKTHTREARKKISLLASRPFEEKYGVERVYVERAKRSRYGVNGFKNSNYRRDLEKNDSEICVKCGGSFKTKGNDGIYVHHIDGNRENNKPENLLYVCPKCHNLKCHNTLKAFLKKGWEVLRGKPDEIDPVEIINIEYIGKKKSYNITMKKNPSFLLGNGILTHNTSDAQNALRRIMEKYSDICIFIFAVNAAEKLIDPIKSRCEVFHFGPLSVEDITERLASVFREEKKLGAFPDNDLPALRKVAEYSQGDMRKALNHLQVLLASGEPLTAGAVETIRPVDYGKIIFDSLQKGRFLEARQNLYKAFELGYAPRYIIQLIHKVYISAELSISVKADAIFELAECDFRMTQGVDKQLAFDKLLLKLLNQIPVNKT